MMNKRYMPCYKVKSQTDDTIVMAIKFSSDLDVYKGHFPGFEITPGVLIVHSIMVLANEFFQLSKFSSRFPNVKFLNPIIPDKELDLEFLWNAEKKELLFKYYSGQTIFSKGTVRYSEGH